MFCPSCGNNCGDANFCSNCGTRLNVARTYSVATEKANAPKSIYQANINGREINLLRVVGEYGADTSRVYSYLKREYGISKEQAKELLAPFKAQEETNRQKQTFKGLVRDVANETGSEMAQKAKMDAAGQIYCPKCLSTSISANQKGFSVGRAAMGAAVGLEVGLIAGGIGSKKVICTCLKCGHQWKAGKK